MGNVQKPATQREMLEQLWYCIIGTNGEGLAAQMKKNNDQTEKLRKDFDTYIDTRLDTCPVRRSKAERIAAITARLTAAGAAITVILAMLEVI